MKRCKKKEVPAQLDGRAKRLGRKERRIVTESIAKKTRRQEKAWKKIRREVRAAMSKSEERKITDGGV